MFRQTQNRSSLFAATFILLHLLVFGELETTNALPLNTSSAVVEEEELTWDISTDNVAAYSIIPMLDLESLIEEHPETRSNFLSRQKRSSKTKQANRRVLSPHIGSLPFLAAVRISNLCSGTLISDRHVLTAAHCVHDRRNYKMKRSQLRVGLPNEDGTFSWKRISNIHISKAWKKGRSRNRNVDSDYAVLVLKHSHSLKYMKPQASKDRVESTLSFNGYPSDQGGRLWHSSCPVKRIGPNGIFLIRCAGSKGTSGSGVYKSLGYGKYAVTGIVSARVKIAKKGNGRHHTVHTFTIINNLTAAKVKRICRWAERDDC